jgi:hypothetical protein
MERRNFVRGLLGLMALPLLKGRKGEPEVPVEEPQKETPPGTLTEDKFLKMLEELEAAHQRTLDEWNRRMAEEAQRRMDEMMFYPRPEPPKEDHSFNNNDYRITWEYWDDCCTAGEVDWKQLGQTVTYGDNSNINVWSTGQRDT